MRKQTKGKRGCGLQNTKKNRKKRRQTRKILKGGNAPIPKQTTITRTPRATPGRSALRSVRRFEPRVKMPQMKQGSLGYMGTISKKPKKKKETKGGSREGEFMCARREKDFAIESPKHGPTGDGFTPSQCIYRQRAQGQHTLCRDCWFDVFVPSEDHSCPGCKKGLEPRRKEVGNWNPGVMVDLTDSP